MHLETGLTQRQAAWTAGWSMLLMAVIAPIAHFGILAGIFRDGDAAGTLGRLTESAAAFRWALLIFLAVLLLDIVIAWALYYLLRPVHEALSLLAGWLRLAYSVLLGVGIFYLLDILNILNGGQTGVGDGVAAAAGSGERILESFGQFSGSWRFSLIIFGLHLLVLGWLLLKAGYMRRVLGPLLILAGAGYILDGVGPILSASYSIEAAGFTFIGELLLIGWLLWAGRRH